MNERAAAAAGDEKLRDNFIRDSEQTILKIASKVTGKYITRSDDEWSVALLAYNKAIDGYSTDKGDFMSYAAVLIKRSLIDHYRSEKKYDHEIPVDGEMLTGEGDYSEGAEVLSAVSREGIEENEKRSRQESLKDEILEVDGILKGYGFSFRDLKDCSPKTQKTKRECAKAITYILDHDNLLETVLEYRRLPISELTEGAGVKSKLLDRYRRYLIMAIVILNGEYPLLADYLQYVRKEQDG